MKAESSCENEALQWAVKFFRDRANDLKEDRRAVEERTEEWILFAHQMTLHGHMGYIELALSEEQNISALCRGAATLIERGESLSKPLQDFVVRFLRDPKKMMK